MPSGDDEFVMQATLLLAYAAASSDTDLPLDRITAALAELGWRHRDGRPLHGYEVCCLSALDILANVSTGPTSRRGHRISAEAAMLARAALRRRHPAPTAT